MHRNNIKYLGNKNKQSEFIVNKINKTIISGDPIIGDLFCGTGVISSRAKLNGHRVHANDYLKQCFIRAEVLLLLNSPPKFGDVTDTLRIKESIPCITPSKYNDVLAHLNDLDGEEGFFYNEYCPGGSRLHGQWERRYFSDENARKIDAIRNEIKRWVRDHQISHLEHELLLFDLMEAVNEVANISGTYGCFLKNFDKCALKSIQLRQARLVPGRIDHIITMEDIFTVCENTKSDIVYLDPPYTKRQYPTYYHILETIALEDEPVIDGKTGLREWKEKASDFCYKRKALKSLEDLITKLWPKDIFFSYSSDGHMRCEDILSLMKNFGDVQIFEYPQKRFKSNRSVTKNKDLKEFLFYLRSEHVDR